VPDDEVDRLRNQLKALHRRMRREQPAVEGLSATALEVLIAIDGAGAPVRPGQLGSELQMTSPNVAAALRSLEALSLVRRRQDPTDGRKAFVGMTARGRKVMAGSRMSWRSWLREAIDGALTDSERRLLFETGNLLQRLADYDPAAPPPRQSPRARASR
jgi:DNA-binding MarR family transcriptional regulator